MMERNLSEEEDIWRSELVDGKWSTRRNLSFLNMAAMNGLYLSLLMVHMV